MNEKTKYNFAEISEVEEAINALYENNKSPDKETREPLVQAIKDFYRTRTILELFEIYDWNDDKDNTSIHDYPSWLREPFDKEMERRSVWVEPEDLKVRNSVLADWSGKDSLESRVKGIQKKLDKIVKLLENFEIRMSVKDALEM